MTCRGKSLRFIKHKSPLAASHIARNFGKDCVKLLSSETKAVHPFSKSYWHFSQAIPARLCSTGAGSYLSSCLIDRLLNERLYKSATLLSLFGLGGSRCVLSMLAATSNKQPPVSTPGSTTARWSDSADSNLPNPSVLSASRSDKASSVLDVLGPNSSTALPRTQSASDFLPPKVDHVTQC